MNYFFGVIYKMIVVWIIILILVIILCGGFAIAVLIGLIIACLYAVKTYMRLEEFSFIDDTNIGGTNMMAERRWYEGEGDEPIEFDNNDVLATRNEIYEARDGADNWYLKDQQGGKYYDMVDDKVVKKQKQSGDKNHRAITGAVTATRNVFDRYLTEELDENEQRDWYDVEADPSNDLLF